MKGDKMSTLVEKWTDVATTKTQKIRYTVMEFNKPLKGDTVQIYFIFYYKGIIASTLSELIDKVDKQSK